MGVSSRRSGAFEVALSPLWASTKHSRSPPSDAAERRWRVIALTNNFSKSEADIIGDAPPPNEQYPNFNVHAELAFLGWQDGATPPRLRALFDDFCDSSTLGMRCTPRILG